MTPFQYRRGQFLKAFGYNPKLKRLGAASSELHLLQDAEEILGGYCWNQCEAIEAIGVEYWNLRKLSKQRDKLLEKMEEAESNLQNTHEKRNENINKIQEGASSLEQKRQKFVQQAQNLALQRQETVRKAGDIKREHDALKAKVSFLKQDGKISDSEIEEAKEKLQNFRERHRSLKNKRLEIVEKITTVEDHLDIVSKEITRRRETVHESASEDFHSIGATNRRLSEYRGELGNVTDEIVVLYRHIGAYLSTNSKDPECQKGFKGQRGLVRKMGALRQSILYNHLLAER